VAVPSTVALHIALGLRMHITALDPHTGIGVLCPALVLGAIVPQGALPRVRDEVTHVRIVFQPWPPLGATGGGIGHTSEQPPLLVRQGGQDRSGHRCASLLNRHLDLALPARQKPLGAGVMAAPTDSLACHMGKSSDDRRVWPSVRRPHERAISDAGPGEFGDRICVMSKLTPETGLCRVTLGPSRVGGSHAHVQGRAASGDSSGGENIGRPGLCAYEPLRFCRNSCICEPDTLHYLLDHRIVPAGRLGGRTGFGVLQLGVQESAATPAATFCRDESSP